MPSEQLVYEGEFSKLLLRGINIAELRFKAYRPAAAATAQASGDTQQTSGDGQAATTSQAATASPPLMLSTDVVSKGWFHKLFGINFRYHVESQVEPNAFYALRTNKVDEQGKRVRTSEAVFDQDARRVEYTERDPNDARQAPRVITAALEGPTQDGFAPLPHQFSFTMSGGAGPYKHLDVSGTLTIDFHHHHGHDTFRLSFA